MIKLIFLLMVTSCASSNILIKKEELVPYKDSSQITKVNQGKMELTIQSVSDLRASKDIGFALTGVQYTKTPLLIDKPVEVFIQDYISDQLELRNIEVLNDSPTRMEISIVNFQVYELAEKFQPEKAKCELQLDFKMNQNAKSWNGSYATEYTSAGDMKDGTTRIAPTMASCFNNLVEKMINDQEFRAFFN